MQRFLKKNHINISSFRNVLDFGCGCGRIIRHFHNQYKTVNLFGCDYNSELVEWCSNNLTFGKFDINHLSPPLKYGSDFFDFIYARSVFTHLGIELQKAWMKEFRRILKTGGYLYLTTHGDNTFNNLTHNERELLNEKGFLIINQEIEGDNRCTCYQTKKFFEENLINGFELIDFSPGKNDSISKQDIYLLKKI